MTTMNKTNSNQLAVRENFLSSEHSLISLKPIVAGLLIAFICYTALTALGIAIGSASLTEMIKSGDYSEGLGIGAIIWMVAVNIVSLGVGSYFAARTSTFVTHRIGAAHGLIIASLYFGLMLLGAGQTIGMAGKGVGYAFGSIGAGAGSLASSSVVQHSVEDAMGAVNLKSEPSVVIGGILTRLIRGNPESAKNYLANQTGLSGAELNTRFNRIENEFKSSAATIGANATSVISRSAWAVFLLLLAGIATAVLSGAWGAGMNFRLPLTDELTNRHQLSKPVVL